MCEERSCPTDETLRAFASGQITDHDHDVVAAHLGHCAACRGVAAEFASPDSAVGLAPGGAAPLLLSGATNVVPLGSTVVDPRPPGSNERSETETAAALLGSILSASDRPGTLGTLAHYEITGVLGRGAMGVVLKGHDPRLGRQIAVKLLAPELSMSSKARRRFEREARAAAAINHPNIVTIYDVNHVGTTPYLVMEFVSGGDLGRRLRRLPPLRLPEVLRISLQTAQALAAAHRHGIIHRDVKPGNILLEEGVGRVKLTDFGLASAAMDVSHITSMGQTVGTPSYIAPERISGADANERSDLFSMGCVMYAMLTGHSPFRGRHTLEVIRNLMDVDPLPLHEVDPSVPRFLSEIVQRLLSKNPDERFPSAQKLAEVLEQHLARVNAMSSDSLAQLDRPVQREHRRAFSARPRLIAVTLVVMVVGAALAALPWLGGAKTGSDSDSGAGDASAAAGAGEHDTRRVLTVSGQERAAFRTLGEALAAAGPNTTIRIADGAVYREALQIQDSERLAGLHIESPLAATLEPPPGIEHAVSIRDTPGVRIEGLRIRAGPDQHCIIAFGECPGLTLGGFTCEVPPESERSAIVFWYGVEGTSDRPIVLETLDLRFGELGVVVLGAEDRACRAIRIRDCRFSSGASVPADEPSGCLILENAAEDVEVTGNLFLAQAGGPDGVTLLRTKSQTLSDIRIANNTFYNVRDWIAFTESSTDQPKITIQRNLVLDENGWSEQSLSAATEVRRWFSENWWDGAPGPRELGDLFEGRIGEIHLLSREPDSPEFLRPPHDTPLRLDAANAYIGALAPASSAD